MPVAVNCSVVPAAIDGSAGVTPIDFSTTAGEPLCGAEQPETNASAKAIAQAAVNERARSSEREAV